MGPEREWKKISDGYAKVFVRECGTPVVGYFERVGEQARTIFFADLEGIETGVGELGGLPDLIDDLKPEDVIEICCFDDRRLASNDLT